MNQDPQQADFVLGTCPDCKKVVRIPVTAVTSQSKSQVCCPICDAAFEIADILDEVIPSVKVLDEVPEKTAHVARPSKPERINAIDTPELFHSKEAEYQPKTEKKNGRFVVPDLLSKGSKSARKKKNKSSRRRRGSGAAEYDPKLAESLAKLKENTSQTTVSSQPTKEVEGHDERSENGRHERSSSERSRSKRPRSERERSERSRSENGRREKGRRSSREANRSSRVRKKGVFADLMAVRDGSELFAWVCNRIPLLGTGDKLNSKWDFLMVGVGVLLAVPVVHLMLWWFIGVDPFGLARPTSYMAPFAVPTSLRTVVEDDDEVAEDSSSALLTDRGVSPINSSANSALQMESGKLPTPKIDPSSVHVD